MAKKTAGKKTAKATKPAKAPKAKVAVKEKKVAKVAKAAPVVVPSKVEAKVDDKPLKGRRKLLKIQQYPPPEVTFIDLAMKGKVTMADLDTHIDMWHDNPESTNLLHEYLGLTPVEYKKLLSDTQNGLQEIVEKRLKKKAKK